MSCRKFLSDLTWALCKNYVKSRTILPQVPKQSKEAIERILEARREAIQEKQAIRTKHLMLVAMHFTTLVIRKLRHSALDARHIYAESILTQFVTTVRHLCMRVGLYGKSRRR